MNVLKRALPVLLAAALALSLAACKKTPAPEPELTPPDPEAVDTVSVSEAAQNMKFAVAGIDAVRQINDSGVIVRATTAEGFSKALAEKTDRTLRLEGAAAGEITLPEGDYTGRAMIFDAPAACVVSNAALGIVTISALNEAGANFYGHVQTAFVEGGNLKVSLSGGADQVFVTGSGADVTLAGGEFGLVYCDNSLAVIRNASGADVSLILPNGTGITIPAGRTYSMQTQTLD